jgi:type I restriction enzyme S subunit
MIGKNRSFKTARIKDVAELDPETLGESTSPDFTFKYIDLSSVKGGRISDQVELMTFAAAPGRARKLIKEGDVLLGMVRPYLKPFAKVPTALDGHVASTGFAVIRAKSDVTDSEYLYQTIWSDGISKQINQMVTGSNYPALSVGDVKDLKIPLPPLAAQRKIAEILRTWDEAIETAEAELKAKKERKRWLMTMVMQKSYETKSVSQFGTLKKGGAILREKLRSKGVPVVLYGDIYTKYSEIVTRLISRVDASAVVDGVKLNSGDIVFAGSGETAEEIGKCIAYVGEEAAYAGGDVVILCNHGQDPRYLGYALNSEDAIRQKMRLGQGSSVMHLYKDDVASIKIPLPPISDQRKVGEILSEADADIELINQRINVLHDQKRGLMQKLLTGEVRVAA